MQEFRHTTSRLVETVLKLEITKTDAMGIMTHEPLVLITVENGPVRITPAKLMDALRRLGVT